MIKGLPRTTGTFTVREIMGEDKYTLFMAQLYGYKVERMSEDELKKTKRNK